MVRAFDSFFMVMMHASCNHPSFLADPRKDAEIITDVPTQAVGTLVVSENARRNHHSLESYSQPRVVGGRRACLVPAIYSLR